MFDVKIFGKKEVSDLGTRLEKYPQLKERVKSILDIIEKKDNKSTVCKPH